MAGVFDLELHDGSGGESLEDNDDAIEIDPQVCIPRDVMIDIFQFVFLSFSVKMYLFIFDTKIYFCFS